MNARTQFIAAAVCFGTLAAAAVRTEEVPIAWKPKVGGILKHHVVITPEIPGMEMTISMDILTKVLKIEEGKITVEETTSNSKMVMNGSEAPGGMDESQTSVYAADHESVSVSTPSPFPRLDEAIAFVYPAKPVDVGGTWKRARTGNAEKGTVDSETTFKYVGKEKAGKWDCYKIEFSFKETKGEKPLKNTGTVWISADDGDMVKSEMATIDFEFQPGVFTNSKSKTTRIE